MTERDNAWELFEKTGRIDAYLSYRARIENNGTNDTTLEVGEDFGIDKDDGRCNQNGKVR